MDSKAVSELHIQEAVLIKFLTAVASHYRDNPYHNFLHAVAVLHGVWLVSHLGV